MRKSYHLKVTDDEARVIEEMRETERKKGDRGNFCQLIRKSLWKDRKFQNVAKAMSVENPF